MKSLFSLFTNLAQPTKQEICEHDNPVSGLSLRPRLRALLVETPKKKAELVVEPFVSGKSAGHDCPAPPCPDGFWLSYASYASENMLSWTFRP